jgi:hypothetical protein
VSTHRRGGRLPGPVPVGLLAAVAAAWVATGTIAPGAAASLSLTSAALTPYGTCVLTATPATTTVVADAEVRQSSPGTGYGAQTTMTITSSGTANRRAYVTFDLTTCSPVIPASATIRLATLRLYVTAIPAVCRTLDLFRVTTAWTEAGLNWGNQPFGTTLNNPATSSRTDSFDVGTPVGCENRTTGAYVTGATVTGDVASFVSGGATNLGWMIRDDVEGAATARSVTISAKQLGTLAQAPQLVVTYVVIP